MTIVHRLGKVDSHIIAGLFWSLLIGGCVTWNILSKEHREDISLSDGGSFTDVLAIDPFTPLDSLVVMHGDMEAHYGSPSDTGTEIVGKTHFLGFEEYVGRYGRIRIWLEHGIDQYDNGIYNRWVTVFTSGLYLSDVLRPSFVADITPAEGTWFIDVRRRDDKTFLVITLEGQAVTTMTFFD